MEIETDLRYGYMIFRVQGDMRTDPDIDELKTRVLDEAKRGKDRIALSFPPTSYPSSRFISFLISCNRVISERGGILAVIQPNKEIVYILATAGLLTFLRIYASEDELAGGPEADQSR